METYEHTEGESWPNPLAASDTDLDDLLDRLRRTRWPAGRGNKDWSQGVPFADIQRLTERWRSTFDWRTVESS